MGAVCDGGNSRGTTQEGWESSMGSMNESSDWVWLTLLLAAALFGFGIYLARTGYRSRRRGDAPHCRRCDYIIAGLETPRCPECGVDLSAEGAIVYGERRMRPGRLGVGLVLVLIGLAVGVVALTPGFRRIEWYQYKPTRWVTTDLKSRDVAVSNRAWRELSRRADAKELSDAQKGSIVDVLLDALSKDQLPAASEPMRYLVGRTKEMSPEQRDRLFGKMLGRLDSQSMAEAEAARDVMQGMIGDGLLKDDQLDKLTEAALAEQAQAQAKSKVAGWLLILLGDRELAGKLTPAQRERFYRQAYNAFDMQVRKKVVVGDTAIYRFSLGGRGPDLPYTGKAPVWWTRHQIDRTMLDGKTQQAGRSSGSGNGFSRGSTQSGVQVKTPGKHRLEVAMTLEVYYSPTVSTPTKEGLKWKKEVVLGGDFEAFAEAPEGLITWDEDPSKAAAIKRSIKPTRLDPTYFSGKGMGVQFEIDKVPENVGFEVFGRVRGKEHSLGTLTAPAGTEINSGFGASKFPPVPEGKMDLILRSSEKAVRNTVGMYSAWKGELVYENVPIDDGKRK